VSRRSTLPRDLYAGPGTPVRRWADPAEMRPVAVFLADPANSFHTGDAVVVDGGCTVF
jgi:NAD(P)-dependent dehydrogenase (short-subunit alcohol dehydrogenase family)